MNRHLIIIYFYCFVCSSIYGIELKKRSVYSKYIPSDCVFPFTYNKVKYDDCTTADGNNGPIPWCSISAEYQGDFMYCIDYRNSSLVCLPKYTINGKEYEGCTYISKTSRYRQCQTDDPDNRYRFCVEEEIKEPSDAPIVDRKNCDAKYKDLSALHTMCVGPAKNAVIIPINATERQQILDKHNQYRGNVTSEYMFKLYWDDELARIAEAHASLCAFDHDLAKNRVTPDYNWLNGQNMVMATDIRTPLATLLDVMFKVEKPNFIYGSTCKGKSDSCLHYTQLMLKDMTRVGCGHAHCLYTDRVERMLTCNYIHSQYVNSSKYPYTPTTESGRVACKKREGNLCDCGNKICDYGKSERIDPATCECVAATDAGPFHKREEGSEAEMEPLEPHSAGSMITVTSDGEFIAERDLHTELHLINKRSPRKYAKLAPNENNDRLTILVR